jgi:hypothetical protein
MKLRLPSKKFLLSSFSILIAITILMSVVPAAYAEGSDPLSPIPGLGRISNNTLIHMHKKEGTWFNEQDDLLKQADALGKTFQQLIDAEAKQGKNVSILQDGLATFEAEVTASREIHLVAGASIFSLVGFKVNGDVRDRLAAGETLLSGHASLREAHVRLTMAMKALRKSFVLWRNSRVQGIPLPPTKTPVPTATKKP